MILTLLRPYALYAASGALVLGSLAAGYWYVRHQGKLDAERTHRESEIQSFRDQTARANAIASRLEQELSASAMRERQLNERLKHELSKDPVYRDCRVPADGVRILQDAVKGSASR